MPAISSTALKIAGRTRPVPPALREPRPPKLPPAEIANGVGLHPLTAAVRATARKRGFR